MPDEYVDPMSNSLEVRILTQTVHVVDGAWKH